MDGPSPGSGKLLQGVVVTWGGGGGAKNHGSQLGDIKRNGQGGDVYDMGKGKKNVITGVDEPERQRFGLRLVRLQNGKPQLIRDGAPSPLERVFEEKLTDTVGHENCQEKNEKRLGPLS